MDNKQNDPSQAGAENQAPINQPAPAQQISQPTKPQSPEIEVSEDIGDAFKEGPTMDVFDKAFKSKDDEADYEKSGLFSGIVKIIITVVAIFAAIIFIFNFVFKTYQIDGSSMEPTFSDGQRVVLWVGSKTFAGLIPGDYVPDRGDVVVVQSPLEQELDFIKRVIGLPGETVYIKDGRLRVINEANPEGFDVDNYLDLELEDSIGEIETIVPEGHIFVAGDNRELGGSFDSRTGLGTIPIENLKGQVLIRFLPISKFNIY